MDIGYEAPRRQRFATQRERAEAAFEAAIADTDALLAELVRRGELELLTNGTYRRPAS